MPPPGSIAMSTASPQYGHTTIASVSTVPSPNGNSSSRSSGRSSSSSEKRRMSGPRALGGVERVVHVADLRRQLAEPGFARAVDAGVHGAIRAGECDVRIVGSLVADAESAAGEALGREVGGAILEVPDGLLERIGERV